MCVCVLTHHHESVVDHIKNQQTLLYIVQVEFDISRHALTLLVGSNYFLIDASFMLPYGSMEQKDSGYFSVFLADLNGKLLHVIIPLRAAVTFCSFVKLLVIM